MSGPGPDCELRLRARMMIDQRRLPDTPPQSIWGGYGTVEPCTLCGKPILPRDIEYELRYGTAQYRLHFRCHAAWQSEQERRAPLKA